MEPWTEVSLERDKCRRCGSATEQVVVREGREENGRKNGKWKEMRRERWFCLDCNLIVRDARPPF